MCVRLLLILFALTFFAAPARSHAPDSGSVPLNGTPFRLQHRTATDIIALFSRATLPDAAHTPRAARNETTDSLLPEGVDAILRGDGAEIVLVGAQPKCQEFAELLRRFDREVTPVDGGKFETRVATGASARELAQRVRTLPGGGTVKVDGSELRLTGSREWLFRALRTALRAETKPSRTDDNGEL
jgi:hypothetical protein